MPVLEYGHASRGIVRRPRFWFAMALVVSVMTLGINVCVHRAPTRSAAGPVGAVPSPQNSVIGSYFYLVRPRVEGPRPEFSVPSANATGARDAVTSSDGMLGTGVLGSDVSTTAPALPLAQFFVLEKTPADGPTVFSGPATQPVTDSAP